MVFFGISQMDKKQTWYIPRPSLSSTSSSHTSKSHDAISCYHRDSEVIDIERSKVKKNSTKNAAASSSSSSLSSQRSKNQIHMETCVDGGCNDGPKRGSRSSQGSSDSEQSIHVWFMKEFLVIILKIERIFFAECIIFTPNCCKLGEFCKDSRPIF